MRKNKTGILSLAVTVIFSSSFINTLKAAPTKNEFAAAKKCHGDLKCLHLVFGENPVPPQFLLPCSDTTNGKKPECKSGTQPIAKMASRNTAKTTKSLSKLSSNSSLTSSFYDGSTVSSEETASVSMRESSSNSITKKAQAPLALNASTKNTTEINLPDAPVPVPREVKPSQQNKSPKESLFGFKAMEFAAGGITGSGGSGPGGGVFIKFFSAPLFFGFHFSAEADATIMQMGGLKSTTLTPLPANPQDPTGNYVASSIANVPATNYIPVLTPTLDAPAIFGKRVSPYAGFQMGMINAPTNVNVTTTMLRNGVPMGAQTGPQSTGQPAWQFGGSIVAGAHVKINPKGNNDIDFRYGNAPGGSSGGYQTFSAGLNHTFTNGGGKALSSAVHAIGKIF